MCRLWATRYALREPSTASLKSAHCSGELVSLSLRFAFLLSLALLVPSVASAQAPAADVEDVAASAAAEGEGPDTEAPRKLTKDEERRNRLAALTFAAQQGEQRGDSATALAHYLRAITIEPNNPTYLTAAGRLALEQDDPKAAFGFLVRAASFSPRDEGVMVLLGRSLARDGRARDALRIFERAIRLGADEADVASDRGFARDLMGEPRRAQRDYQIALARRPNDVTTISRMGLSLAISGDRAAALSTLQPLVATSDGGAQRTLAFANALTGDGAAAMTITQSAMPGAAAGMARLVEALPHLNAEEKARAVHFGDLPTASAMAASKPSLASRLLAVLRPEKPPEPTVAKPALPHLQSTIVSSPAQSTATASSAPASVVSPKAQTPLDIALAVCAEGAPGARSRCEANARALARRCAGGRNTAECKAFDSAERPAVAPVRAQTPLDIALAKCATGRANARSRCDASAQALAKRCASGRRTAECLDFRNASPPAVALAAVAAAPAKAQTPLEIALADCAKGRAGARRQCEIDARALAARCAGGRKTAECVAFAGREAGTNVSASVDASVSAPVATPASSATRPARPVDQVALICADAAGPALRQCEIDARALVRRCTGGRKTAECLALAELGETRAASVSASASVRATPPAAKARPAARVWVQVASGSNRGDLPKEWQRLKQAHATALRGQSASVAANGRSNRMVIGPFKDQAAAGAMVNRLRASGLSAFPWKSGVGEAVDALPGG